MNILTQLTNLFDTRQFVIIAGLLLVAWILQPLLRRLFAPLLHRLPQSEWRDWLAHIFRRISLPLTALLLGQIALGILLSLEENSNWVL
ncbi:MAG: hypothetical protein D6768_05410, partial [Chloroflexi bacterium]